MNVLKALRRGGDRGATLVEYALIVAVIMVVSIGVIQKVQDGGKAELEASDARVTAGDGAYYVPIASTTTTVGATTTTTVGPISVHLASNPTITIADVSGNKWQVTITFTLKDASDNGVIGATMNGSWSNGGSGSNPVGTCTTSTSAGQCTVQFTKIRDSVQDVTYTLSSISGGTFTWVPSLPGEGTRTVNCGSVC